MEDQAGEFVVGFRVDERADFGIFFPLGLAVASAGGSMVSGDGCIRRQFADFVDG